MEVGGKKVSLHRFPADQKIASAWGKNAFFILFLKIVLWCVCVCVGGGGCCFVCLFVVVFGFTAYLDRQPI